MEDKGWDKMREQITGRICMDTGDKKEK